MKVSQEWPRKLTSTTRLLIHYVLKVNEEKITHLEYTHFMKKIFNFKISFILVLLISILIVIKIY